MRLKLLQRNKYGGIKVFIGFVIGFFDLSADPASWQSPHFKRKQI